MRTWYSLEAHGITQAAISTGMKYGYIRGRIKQLVINEQIQATYILVGEIFNLITPKYSPIKQNATRENKQGVKIFQFNL